MSSVTDPSSSLCVLSINTYFTGDAFKLRTPLFLNPVTSFCLITGIKSVVFLANVVSASRLLSTTKVMRHAIFGHKEPKRPAECGWKKWELKKQNKTTDERAQIQCNYQCVIMPLKRDEGSWSLYGPLQFFGERSKKCAEEMIFVSLKGISMNVFQ